MPDDATQPASLAYRKYREDLWEGRVPEKYSRLLPHIPGGRVLELGAAEGVLSLLLARRGVVDSVTALELREYRHAEGLLLRNRWQALGYDVSRCAMVCGDIVRRLDLLAGIDTLVAVRSIYYLRHQSTDVLHEAHRQGVGRVVLCGNRSRQTQSRKDPDSDLGRFNYLASVEGMAALLAAAGYRVDTIVDEGDPIVVGRHPRLA